ncbi:zinc finger protein 429-like [Diabrotica virgifera virgifera]|uniref:C2H2-type domain-containing protein n=1 Tax=Diabrotica virgifera virgifera TaxID=50390 RepID=A0ABM5KJ24_DIAVI|nr:zinc finger protein 429-like [Diabrotica virgifera virgifera]
MEVKQEVGEETYKIEIDTEVNNALLDSCKIEIKEEPKRESIHDTCGYEDLKKTPMKIEIGQDEHTQTNEKGFPQEVNTLEIIKTIHVHSNDKKQPMNRPAEGKTLKCEICAKQFAKKGYLNEHMKIHSGEKPHNCEICSKQFIQAGRLKRHLRIHTGEKPYKCKICFQQFSDTSNLKKHSMVHTGEKRYKCQICFKLFSEGSTLKKHLRVHTGEKPHKCEICLKPFSQSCALKLHIRLHTGEKPHKCEICFRQFSQKGQLKTHLKTHSRSVLSTQV